MKEKTKSIIWIIVIVAFVLLELFGVIGRLREAIFGESKQEREAREQMLAEQAYEDGYQDGYTDGLLEAQHEEN